MSTLKDRVRKASWLSSLRLFELPGSGAEFDPGPVGLRIMRILTDVGEFPRWFGLGECAGLLPWQYARVSFLEERWWHDGATPGATYLELLNVWEGESANHATDPTNDVVSTVSDLLRFAYYSGIQDGPEIASFNSARLEHVYRQWTATTTRPMPIFGQSFPTEWWEDPRGPWRRTLADRDWMAWRRQCWLPSAAVGTVKAGRMGRHLRPWGRWATWHGD